MGEKSISSEVYNRRREGKAIRINTTPGRNVQIISRLWFSVVFIDEFLLVMNRIDMYRTIEVIMIRILIM
jgi:hypothetical protein